MDSKNMFTLSHPYGSVAMAVASKDCIELLKMQGIEIPSNVEPIADMEEVIKNPYEFVDESKYGVALYATPFCEPVVCYLPLREEEEGKTVGLEPLHDAVGGSVEHITTECETGFDIWVNEEGLYGLPVNRPLLFDGEVFDCVKGNMLITGCDYNVGTTIGLTPEQLKEAWNMYKIPCVVSIENREFFVSRYVNNEQNREFLSVLFDNLRSNPNPNAIIYSRRSIKEAEQAYGARQVGSINLREGDRNDR